MALNFTGGQIAYEQMIDNFSKSLDYIPVTKTTSGVSGNETLTEGTTSSITGAFFRQEDNYVRDKPGLIQDADAILMVKKDVTVNKNDIIGYEGEEYRIEKIVPRKLDGTVFYNLARCYKV